MESPIRYVITFLFAFVLLFLSSSSPTNASTQLVQDVCKKTINNAECLKVLESDPRAGSASTYKHLAQVALDLAIANAKDSQAFIDNLLKSDPREAIKECASSYQFVVAQFSIAKAEIQQDPMTANYDAKVAADDVGTCETALSSKRINIPEISTRNHFVQLYSNIGDVITRQLY